MICCKVNPNFTSSDSDSFATGRSSVLYVFNNLFNKFFSWGPCKLSVNGNNTKFSCKTCTCPGFWLIRCFKFFNIFFNLIKYTKVQNLNGLNRSGRTAQKVKKSEHKLKYYKLKLIYSLNVFYTVPPTIRPPRFLLGQACPHLAHENFPIFIYTTTFIVFV